VLAKAGSGPVRWLWPAIAAGAVAVAGPAGTVADSAATIAKSVGTVGGICQIPSSTPITDAVLTAASLVGGEDLAAFAQSVMQIVSTQPARCWSWQSSSISQPAAILLVLAVLSTFARPSID
jgi:hypothetical protein